MKEKIYTIPVNDAYRSDCACPLCRLRADVENASVEYFLGASLMEPDTRIETNKAGFCHEHYLLLYGKEINRLGLGLIIHTHLKELEKDIGATMDKVAPDKRTLLKGRDSDFKRRLNDAADLIEKRVDDCIVCRKIEFTMDRYLDVLLWLYFEDDAFKKVFSEKKGHCLKHVAFLLRGAAKYLKQNQASEFAADLVASHSSGFGEMIEDVEGFTLKFDYRNKDKPWGNSKDAIPRAIAMLSGEDGKSNGRG